MIRVLLCILLTASPALAVQLVPLSDHIGKGMADEAGRGLLDENSELTTVITRAPSFAVTTFAPPGHEADVCSPPMGRPILNDPTPFLFANDAASKQKFYGIPGRPWATRLELVNYGGNTDYQGFTFTAAFVPTAPQIVTHTPYLLDVMTSVTETTVDGVSSTVWTDFSTYQMQAFPFGYSQGQYFPLPDNWQVTFDPCTGTELPIFTCRLISGPWPIVWTGTSENGVKQWQFLRQVAYDHVVYSDTGATVSAGPGVLDVSMTAEQTSSMTGYIGELRISVLRPIEPITVTTTEQVGILDEIGHALFTEAELPLYGLGSVSSEVAQTTSTTLNGLPMQFIP